jgi:two-component SAPR family response regulator
MEVEMRVVIIDDEIPAIDEIVYFLKEYSLEIVGTYHNPLQALDCIMADNPDLIFIDIEMPRLNGIELAIKIQNLINHIIIVFVTAYSQYALEAFRVHPIDYILKPIESNAFSNAMQYVIKQYELLQNQLSKEELGDVNDKVSVNCFGNFEVIKDNVRMKFATKKSKELLAYLIYNTDKVFYRDEMLRALFPSSDVTKAQNNFYVTLYRLRNTMNEFGIKKEDFYIQDNYTIHANDCLCNYINFTKVIKNKNKITDITIKDCEKIIEQYQAELFLDIQAVWVDEAREMVNIEIESLIFRMISYYIERKEYHHAERVLMFLLEINPLSGIGYETLLDLYIHNDNQPAYRLLYKKYAEFMKEEMRLEIAQEYSDYYIKIMFE